MYENKIIFRKELLRSENYTAKKEYSGPIPWGFRRNVPYFNIKIIIRRKMIEKIVNNLVKNFIKNRDNKKRREKFFMNMELGYYLHPFLIRFG